MVMPEVSERLLKMIFEGVQTVEDTVEKTLLPQFIPHMSDRIEFRGIGRQV